MRDLPAQHLLGPGEDVLAGQCGLALPPPLELALRNAARHTGTAVVLVNPAYTSQTCNRCKHVDPKSRKSQADFRCTACGHRAHADVNAAKNILDKHHNAAGHAVSRRGDLGTSRSVKRQPRRRAHARPKSPCLGAERKSKRTL
ncbi:zinc ribbon domain-containing protein [Embleya sp. NBC_00896]|uniref:zinc ribbon domain-containing protein n=1 Tax=Embleya sp. NBC_00896 TaxID=2975961 RepID=UPI00386885BB